MIVLKTSRELSIMRKAGKISQKALRLAGEAVEPGVSTWEIDKIVRQYIESEGATPSFLNYSGYPASACISVNNVVIHGIPSKSVLLKKGDIVSLDIGACYEGYHGDNAWTFPCGEISAEAQALLDATEKSLFLGIEQAVPGNRLGDIGHAVQAYAEARGYSVVREFVGHGVGAKLHEDPSVPNYGTPGRGVRLMPGMVIAIEPMVNMGKPGVEILDDGWTTITRDGSLSAHFEHTVAITPDGPVLLTALDGGGLWSGHEARWQGPLPAMIKAAFSRCWRRPPPMGWWPTANAAPWNAPSGRNSSTWRPRGQSSRKRP